LVENRETKIFLIDFGDTMERHAVIDHTTLECSLKFRHIPKFVDIKVLQELETELKSDESFSKDYEPGGKLRSDLVNFFNYFKVIRTLSLPFQQDKIEYFISLFMITFRQIQYPGLNQLYALKSAEILSEKIVSDLNL
ncbi:MAG: hypothetical protein IH950_13390, partial [Bacteroidetes bacterium]|nr:hypothetical protein [Bacteroidota bacterium]